MEQEYERNEIDIKQQSKKKKKKDEDYLYGVRVKHFNKQLVNDRKHKHFGRIDQE